MSFFFIKLCIRIRNASIFILLFSSISSCKNTTNLCYVNPNQLLKNYHGSAVQHKLFQTKLQSWQQHVDSLSTELQALTKASTITRDAKKQQLLRYRNAIQQQARQEDQRLTKTVLEEINSYLKQYGKDHGYTFIFGATESGNIVYAAEGTDITQEVLKGLNTQYDSQYPNSAR